MNKKFTSKIFLDGGDPDETLEVRNLLGFLDGQTTNPTLISKNPLIMQRITGGNKFSKEELLNFYKKTVTAIAALVDWSVSIEPYVGHNTAVEEIFSQVQEMASWTSKAWIKLPLTPNGLEAARLAIRQGIAVNLTLCFSQEQAAAVYAATSLAKKPVFVSPFVGRLDDRGENGMQLIANILKMFEKGDGHVLTLTASVRNIKHFLWALKLKSPVITAPLKVIQEWAQMNFIVPADDFVYDASSFKPITYKEISLDEKWMSYDITHPLTDDGIDKFCEDWDKLVR